MWVFVAAPYLQPAGACYNDAFPGRVAACPKKMEMIRMRALYKDAVNETRIVDVTTEALTAVMSGGQGLLWVDLMGDGGAIENLLQQTFGFHPLAIDDALHETHIPKVDDWGTYLYLVFQDVAYDAAQRTILLPELDVFLGRGFLVTYHKHPIAAVDQVWEMCQRDTRWLQHGADHLLYRLIDELVDRYLLAIDDMEEDLAQLENSIFDEPSPALLEQLFIFKRMCLRLRRVLAPQREVVNKLARDDYATIGPKDRIYFRDVADHMIRLYDMSDNLRDLVLGSMDIYLSVVNNRMNDIMKTLTIITTLFMPLTFLTGFFGMNFFQAVLPSNFWTGMGMLAFVLGFMLLLPVAMFWWMRRRAWM